MSERILVLANEKLGSRLAQILWEKGYRVSCPTTAQGALEGLLVVGLVIVDVASDPQTLLPSDLRGWTNAPILAIGVNESDVVLCLMEYRWDYCLPKQPSPEMLGAVVDMLFRRGSRAHAA